MKMMMTFFDELFLLLFLLVLETLTDQESTDC